MGLLLHVEIGTDNLHAEHPDIGIVQPSGSCFEIGGLVFMSQGSSSQVEADT
jgi:hypothetical protein